MNKQELLQVYAYAAAIWSSFKLPTIQLDLRLMNEVWYECLKDYPINVILNALKQYAGQSDFCNIVKVAEICEKYYQILNGTYINEEAVLSNIKKAVSYTHCKENYEKLTDFEKEIVGGPHMLARWAMSDAFETVIVSNLRKTITNKLAERQQNKIVNRLTNSGIKQIEL